MVLFVLIIEWINGPSFGRSVLFWFAFEEACHESGLQFEGQQFRIYWGQCFWKGLFCSWYLDFQLILLWELTAQASILSEDCCVLIRAQYGSSQHSHASNHGKDENLMESNIHDEWLWKVRGGIGIQLSWSESSCNETLEETSALWFYLLCSPNEQNWLLEVELMTVSGCDWIFIHLVQKCCLRFQNTCKRVCRSVLLALQDWLVYYQDGYWRC